MKYRKTTARTVATDLRAFAVFLESDNASAEDRKSAAKCLNVVLDVLAGDDVFGTEGQCDPRGDHRS